MNAPLSSRRTLPPEHLPSPSLWPPALALGVTLTFWGLIASLVILGAGLAVMAVALIGWLSHLRDERRNHPSA
jgi:hypothetical protein